MFLGIEIGGTKLQLGLGRGDGVLESLQRLDVRAADGAAGILAQIEEALASLTGSSSPSAIGVGFGGPVDSRTSRVTKSHQVEGWDGFPLRDWLTERTGAPTILGNDCDVAALAEARHGAGRGRRRVFYVTVGTGVGGGLVLDGRWQGGSRPAMAEVGHLRPGLDADQPHLTVEQQASGWGIANALRRKLDEHASNASETLPEIENRVAWWERGGGSLDRLTAKDVAEAARAGDPLALEVFENATRTLGWAIAQVITLVAPEVVVVGGGVSLAGRRLFFDRLDAWTEEYVFPPLQGTYTIAPAQLGEEVVVHGALALAERAAAGEEETR